MKHLFIVNPIAGGRDKSEEVRALAEEVFAGRGGGGYELYVTKAPMDACDKLKSLADDGEEYRVYACGGDGTFNECVCGAAKVENIAVCPFPTGTGNDFCRMFGEEKELFKDLEAILDGSIREIDLIDCNGRYSANICSVGVDARVGINVHKYSKLPIIGGAAGYVISALVEIFKGINTAMKIKTGDYEYEGESALVCVCNGRYYGGGFKPSLTAMPDDGMLDILIARKINLLQFAMLIGKYASGRAKELTKHIKFIEGSEISIEFEEENVVNIDGEAMYTKRADIKIVPASLRLIVPAGMSFFDNVTKI